jgi:hypothetical protein
VSVKYTFEFHFSSLQLNLLLAYRAKPWVHRKTRSLQTRDARMPDNFPKDRGAQEERPIHANYVPQSSPSFGTWAPIQPTIPLGMMNAGTGGNSWPVPQNPFAQAQSLLGNPNQLHNMNAAVAGGSVPQMNTIQLMQQSLMMTNTTPLQVPRLMPPLLPPGIYGTTPHDMGVATGAPSTGFSTAATSQPQIPLPPYKRYMVPPLQEEEEEEPKYTFTKEQILRNLLHVDNMAETYSGALKVSLLRQLKSSIIC